MIALSAYLLYSIPLTAYIKPEDRKKKQTMFTALAHQINRNRQIDKNAEQNLKKQIEHEINSELEFRKVIDKASLCLKDSRDRYKTCAKDLIKDLHTAQGIIRNKGA